MNDSSLQQESNEAAPEQKLLGLSRPLAGALIGILLYSLLVLLSLIAKLEWFGLTILLPGIAASNSLDNRFFRVIILFGVPSVPFALFGSLILSKQEAKKTIGTLALIIYFLLLMTVGLPMVAMMGDY